MKKTKIKTLITGILFSLISILVFNSCCTKKYCYGVDDLDNISFYGFSQQDLDSIVIKKYNKNTNFQHILDSVFIEPEHFISNNEYEMLYLTDNFVIDYDYEVELLSTGQVYAFTDFTVEKKKCNKGFLCFDYFESLESYKVNGEKQTDSYLRINK